MNASYQFDSSVAPQRPLQLHLPEGQTERAFALLLDARALLNQEQSDTGLERILPPYTLGMGFGISR